MKIRIFALSILLLATMGFASTALAAVTVTTLGTGDAAEGDPPTAGSFLVEIDVARGADVTISFDMTGTADAGGDYTLSSANPLTFDTNTGSGTVDIIKGALSVVVNVDPVADDLVEPVETVTMTLTAASLPSVSLGDPITDSINITSDDAALTLVKQVVGLADPTAWTLTADGTGDNDLSGPGGATGTVVADTFALSESGGPVGYTASDWVCTGDGVQSGASITLAAGDVATCTITNTAPDTILTLVKQVVGLADPTAWTLTADGTADNDLSGAGGATGTVDPDTFALSESGGPVGYTASDWVCVGGSQTGASITLAEGDDATCTITNTAPDTTLTLVKEVVGAADPTEWTLTADGTDANDLSGAGGATGTVDPDTFALSESAGPGGYTASDWVCVGGSQTGASITLAEGDDATCTITNTADAPETTLTLVKEVVGAADPTEWTLTADGTDANDLSGAGGATGIVDPDTFALSESAGPGGYTAGDWVCVGGSQTGASITLAEGESATCTIINTADVTPTTLTLVKEVVGAADPTEWTLTADGTDANDLSGAGGATGEVLPDTFALSESAGPGGYTAGDWVCVGGTQVNASITLAEGESATCTIINTADVLPTTLTLVKEVVGAADPTEWTLTADGTDANDLSGAGGATGEVLPDTFALSESAGPGGYTAGDWVCVGGSQTGASITLAEGESATCTIINTADVLPTTLTLVKEVVGAADPTEWTLTADGTDANDLSGAGGATGEVLPDTFALSESAGPGGYTAGDWVCVGGTQVNASITLAEGESATCTIINTADVTPTTLTLVKEVVGAADPTEWTLTADGTDANDLSGAGGATGEVLPDTFALSESAGPGGYTAGDWVCVGGTQVDASITLAEGESATCTIINTADATPTTLTLVKEVVGAADPTEWTLTADGTDANDLSGAGGATGEVLPDTFALSESAGPDGYTAGDWVCVGGTQVDASITLAEGEVATCTIINTFVAESALTLLKQADTLTYSLVDEVIGYTYTVTNSGNVPVAGPIEIVDDKETPICPPLTGIGNNDENLDPEDGPLVCLASHTVVQADITAGSITNIATARGDGGSTVSNEETLVVTYAEPVLTLVKEADVTDFSVLGEVINYTYTVTASVGPVPGPITVDDDKVTVSCPDVTTVDDFDENLDPGETIVCTASHVVVGDDITAQEITNIATASGNAGGTVSESDTVTVSYLPPGSPRLALEITASPETYIRVGDVIDFTYVISSTGNAPVIGPINVVNSRMTVTCPPINSVGNLDDNLDVGEILICTSSLVVTLEDTAGSFISTTTTVTAPANEILLPEPGEIVREFAVMYTPLPIPTLSEWAMILLSSLFLMMGVTHLRRRQKI